jgi:hypothetical protein
LELIKNGWEYINLEKVKKMLEDLYKIAAGKMRYWSCRTKTTLIHCIELQMVRQEIFGIYEELSFLASIDVKSFLSSPK